MLVPLLALLASAASAPCPAGLICGPQNAEDLERVAGTPWIIASSMHGALLYRLDARNGAWETLTVHSPAARIASRSDCATPPAAGEFAGHGIAIRQGRQPRLYAVNHARGAIEMFAIAPQDARLRWRGCIRLPADMMANGVAPLPDGGIAATGFSTPGTDFTKAMVEGTPTGDVRIWHPRRGWSSIAGSAASVANGIAARADGKIIFVAVTGAAEIWQIDLQAGASGIARAKLDFSPDNLRWDDDGRLLTTGFTGTAADAVACFARPQCVLGYAVAVIDPATLSSRTLLRCAGGGRFGNASAALPVGGELWLGTFRGAAIARTPTAPDRNGSNEVLAAACPP